MAEFSTPTTLTQSILWTVAYTDQFSYPLTAAEIWHRLLAFHSAKKLTAKKLPVVTPRHVQRRLATLQRQKKLGCEKDFYFLAGRQKVLKTRLARAQVAQLKWQEVAQFVQFAKWIPWVESIWVTGSLAMSNAQAQQDIDFMIITQPRRLWLTRLLITTLVWLRHKKRKPGGLEKQTWCFNLWLDTHHLAIPAQKRNVYTAYEVIQAQAVFARHDADQRFWQANRWVRLFLLHWQSPQQSFRHHKNLFPKNNLLMDVFETFFFHLQWLYMKRHHTTEDVAAGYAFFHPRQTAQLVAQQWQQRINKLQ